MTKGQPNKPKYNLPPLTPAVLKMSRALLGWSQKDLAQHGHMEPSSIARLESKDSKPGITKYWAIRGAIENNHLSFIEEDGQIVGVRWPKGYY